MGFARIVHNEIAQRRLPPLMSIAMLPRCHAFYSFRSAHASVPFSHRDSPLRPNALTPNVSVDAQIANFTHFGYDKISLNEWKIASEYSM